MLWIKIKTAFSIGLINICYVIGYRLRLKLTIHPVQRISSTLPGGPFFAKSIEPSPENSDTKARLIYFGWKEVELEEEPDWFLNPFTNSRFNDTKRDWWEIADFDNESGDIKIIWEPSRFSWLFDHIEKYRAGDKSALQTTERWLSDWISKNPPYKGPNWKCAQEASIRVIHMSAACFLLKLEKSPSIAFINFIDMHLTRIAPTMDYAQAQNNNHIISEAAAMFIGGQWLATNGIDTGRRWHTQGRALLNRSARRLIANDGSFSQYSTNYHRLMLDTFSLVESCIRKMGIDKLEPETYERLSSATSWLHTLTDESTGGVPNLGHNDGARILPILPCAQHDYRPSVHLAAALFLDKVAYSQDGIWNDYLKLFDIPRPTDKTGIPQSTQYNDGGYFVIHRNSSMLLMRYPRFLHRPSHADALHLDFWIDGLNILRDGGSYSYAAENKILNYYAGTESHNTIQFDDRDQMPRISRFLFGNWLKTRKLENLHEDQAESVCAAGYEDYAGSYHFREIRLSDNTLTIKDEIKNFRKQAVLRWRLRHDDWTLSDNTVSNGRIHLKINSDIRDLEIRLTQAPESRLYHNEDHITVLEVVVKEEGSIITVLEF